MRQRVDYLKNSGTQIAGWREVYVEEVSRVFGFETFSNDWLTYTITLLLLARLRNTNMIKNFETSQ